MKLVVFGATGGTGRNVAKRALALGHDVVAVARRPEAVDLRHERLRVHKADAADAAAVAAALDRADCAVIAVGPADNKKPGTVISSCAKNVVAGAEQQSVSRVVLESGLMMTDGAELSFVGRIMIKLYRSTVRALYEDKRIAEAAVTGSGREWVIVRPPNLEHQPARGDYIAGPRMRVRPTKPLTHADCADCLVRAAVGEWTGEIVNVGY